MSTFVPYVSANFDELGTIVLDEFSFNLGPTFDDADSSEFVDTSWITTKAGVTPIYLFNTDFNVDYVIALELGGATAPSFSNFSEIGVGASYSFYSGLPSSYTTLVDVDEKEAELGILQDQYQKYGRSGEYRNFDTAYNGIVDTLTNEVYDLINKDEPVVLFKKTTQKPINLNSLAVLTSSVTPSTQTTTTTSTTTTTTTTAAGSSYSGGGTSSGGGGY